MLGTLVNSGAIILGGLVGIMIHSRLPQKMVNIVFQGVGLCTIGIGISMSIQAQQIILIVLSIVIGSIIGQTIEIEKYVRKLSEYAQIIGNRNKQKENSSRFTEGFVTASMLFCIGSMSILGAIEDGMGETPNLLYTKSIMDGIASVAFASTFGIGVLFTSIPVFLYQGGLTLFAGYIMSFMNEAMIADMTATGGILLIGLGINILKIKELQIINMLPSLVIIVLLTWWF